MQQPSATATIAADGAATADYTTTLSGRRAVYGPNAALSYEQPLMVVRGQGTYLYDEKGVSYLDCVNNVCHLGHGHAEVASAVCSQLHTLNTNSRYLHPTLPDYTARLLATLNTHHNPSAATSLTSTPTPTTSTSPTTPTTQEKPSPPSPPPRRPHGPSGPSLDVLYLVCSGSEANDLALRIITAARPGATHIAVMGGAYHGHLSSLIPLSPYKFWGVGGTGKPPHVHVVPCPDPYRGENLDGRVAALAVVAAAGRAGGMLGGFFCESILSCGGQVVLPPGYLQAIYDVFRAEGVLVVADEVQCGFGRCGSAFWGFQTQGVAPDIVTMGKPIGNGYPLAALATSRALAAAFAAPGMEYFNTYGGSTAAVAAGAAVLTVLQRDGWQHHALRVGEYLLSGLRALQSRHPDLVGEVRGLGLIIGVEVVRDAVSKRHAPVTARWIKERMKARHVLLSTDGPYDNVIKIKPPLVFGRAEADELMAQLSAVLSSELTPHVRAKLEAAEEAHWAAVLAPRHASYKENERMLYNLLTCDGNGMRQSKL